jgi:hypothetical protein
LCNSVTFSLQRGVAILLALFVACLGEIYSIFSPLLVEVVVVRSKLFRPSPHSTRQGSQFRCPNQDVGPLSWALTKVSSILRSIQTHENNLRDTLHIPYLHRTTGHPLVGESLNRVHKRAKPVAMISSLDRFYRLVLYPRSL